jgi:hypothetical protein
MRTQTLLIAAATALAAAITSSQAQTVYSANVVGYVNEALTPGANALITPALDIDGTGTNGTISNVVGTNVASGTAVLSWNGTGFTTLTWSRLPGTPPTSPKVWWTTVGATPTATNGFPLNVGQGFFIDDPSDTNLTLTGNVLSGTRTQNLPAGVDSLVGSDIPYGGDITNLTYVPGSGDAALLWNGAGYSTYTFSRIPGTPPTSPKVWWTTIGSTPTAQDPVINVGQGFFIDPATANAWSETFTNN